MIKKTSEGKVVILIPTYNYGKYLREAIDSALAQDYPNVEIVVANDGSTDDTEDILQSYGNKITYYSWENAGVYSTRQKALAVIDGEYFLNLDADNRLFPQAVSAFVEALESAPSDVGFAYCHRMRFGSTEGISKSHEFSVERLKLKNYLDMGSMIKMKVVKEIGFDPEFDSGMGDYDFFLSAVSKGYRGVLIDQALYEYRTHLESITRRLHLSANKVAVSKKLLSKHASFFSEKEKREFLQHARYKVCIALQKELDHRPTFWERMRRVGLVVRYERAPRQLIRSLLINLGLRKGKL